jgi:hypothetical protein
LLNGNYSSEGLVTCGVPQGSILGPLLFNIFINDLPYSISHHDATCDLFADDTTIHTSNSKVPKINEVLQQSLDEVSSWCKHNHMIISVQKTKSMLITSRQKHQRGLLPLTLYLDSEPLDQVKKHRLLGVTVDDQLSWAPHIESTCKTISKNLFLLSKLSQIVNTDTRRLFLHAHIKSHCDYCSTLWDGCCEVHLKKLNSLYRRGVKLTVPGPSPTDEKFRTIRLLNLNKQLTFNRCILMHKILIHKSNLTFVCYF